MRVIPTRLAGPLLIACAVHEDARGFFQETYRRNVFAGLGIAEEFVQENHSRSRQGIVRGMHLQPGMTKLIRCARGAILDVLVDVRVGSPNRGEWESFELDDHNHRQLYCPDGFAHGFCVLSETADVIYSCSDYYDSERELGFSYADPEVGVGWPAGIELTPSPRDAAAPPLRDLDLTAFRHT